MSPIMFALALTLACVRCHAMQVHWSLNSGCSESGFFYEFLGIAKQLDARVPIVLQTGKCNGHQLQILSQDEAAVMQVSLFLIPPVTRFEATCSTLLDSFCDSFAQHLQRLSSNQLTSNQISVEAGFPGDGIGRFRKDNLPIYSVGRVMTESVHVPPHWVKGMNRVDEVWVPTEWQVHLPCTSPVTVVPEECGDI